jgi:hypothetical protein
MSFNQPNAAAKAQIAYEIRQTISELKDRGLLVAAKWSVQVPTPVFQQLQVPLKSRMI